jgi:hypothetical protein
MTAVDVRGVLGGKVIKTIVPGYQHYVALSTDGHVYTWGLNSYGQLGNGNASVSQIPYPMVAHHLRPLLHRHLHQRQHLHLIQLLRRLLLHQHLRLCAITIFFLFAVITVSVLPLIHVNVIRPSLLGTNAKSTCSQHQLHT